MKHNATVIKVALMLALSCKSLLAGEVMEPGTGIAFPEQVTLDGQTYRLKGTSMRAVNLLVVKIRIYAIGYYTVAGDDRLKAFRVVAAREMTSDRITKALSEAIENKPGAVPPAAKPFFAKVQTAPEGQVAWYYNSSPERYSFRQGDGEPILLDSQVAGAIYSGWIEEGIASHGMREELLGLKRR